MPATTVGSANGRSITPLRAAFPGNLSRTRTHAIAVPARTLITTTMSDAITVHLSAHQASGFEIAFQNELQPPSVDCAMSAAIGISTMMLRYPVTRPRPSAAPPRRGQTAGLGGAALEVSVRAVLIRSKPTAPIPDRRRGCFLARESSLSARGDPQVLLVLGD